MLRSIFEQEIKLPKESANLQSKANYALKCILQKESAEVNTKIALWVVINGAIIQLLMVETGTSTYSASFLSIFLMCITLTLCRSEKLKPVMENCSLDKFFKDEDDTQTRFILNTFIECANELEHDPDFLHGSGSTNIKLVKKCLQAYIAGQELELGAKAAILAESGGIKNLAYKKFG